MYATIMAGGTGTRFWPASRRAHPKQLLTLTGTRSMLQSTVDRLEGLCPAQNLLILTNRDLVDPVAEQLPQIDRQSIIGEPAKRDTAPCIALAASLIAARDPSATMVVMPADHVIGPVEVFQNAIRAAATLVEDDPTRIVTFGIKPSYPAEVFGYIEAGGDPLAGTELPAFPIEQFREKPDRATAQRFLDAGTFFWNSGIFVWRAQTILDALARFEPEMAGRIQTIAARLGQPDFQSVLEREFTAIRGKSIDFAVMEHYDNGVVMQAPFAWDDLGNWSALPRLNGTDEQGNTVSGRFLGIDTCDSIIQASPDESEHLIVTVGLRDCIVIHTPNATLVADRHQEAAIKKVVQHLEQRQWDEYL